MIIEGLGMFLCHGVSAKIFERFLQHVLLFILNLIKREGTDLTELIGAHIWKHAKFLLHPHGCGQNCVELSLSDIGDHHAP